MLAQGESRRCVFVVQIGCAADYNRFKTFDSEQFARGSTGDGNSKIATNLCRFFKIIILNGDKFSVGMGKERRDVGESRPPSRTDDSALDLVPHTSSSRPKSE